MKRDENNLDIFSSDLDKSISRRLRGARIAAGFLVAKDASARIGVPNATYAAAENGDLGNVDRVAEIAAGYFNVSRSFVIDGNAATAMEELADRISRLLEEGVVLDGAHERLAQARRSYGFETMADATRHNGWAAATYSNHEGGVTKIPFDRIVGYALALGARPEYLVRGELPISDSLDFSWIDKRVEGLNDDGPTAAQWVWLRSAKPGRAVLNLRDGRLVVCEDRFSVPSVIPASKLEQAGSDGFFLQVEEEFWLISPSSSLYGEIVCVFESKEVVILNGAVVSNPLPDPTRVSTGGLVQLGRLICKVKISVH